MNILVLGANGKVGSLVVSELCNYEHNIRAFVHNYNSLSDAENLEIFNGDIYDSESLRKALVDIEVVISCLGSWGTKYKNVLSTAMEKIVPIMQHKDVDRIISLTGAEARCTNEPVSLLQKFTYPLFNALAGKILQDANRHIETLKHSSLDWTVIRSPVMNDKGDPKKFDLRNKYPAPFKTINRHSVALAIINQIYDNTYIKQAPYIHRK